MKNLDEFYRLRTDFTIIGLTGRVGSGCSEIANKLCDERFINNIANTDDIRLDINTHKIKYNICKDFLNYSGNWRKFQKINYKDVLLFHLIHCANKKETITDVIQEIIDIICQNGNRFYEGKPIENRFEKEEDQNVLNELKSFLNDKSDIINQEKEFHKLSNELNDSISNDYKMLYDFYFSIKYEVFCREFYNILDKGNLTKRSRLTHDLAYHLRKNGTVLYTVDSDTSYMFTIADTINQLIKSWRKESGSNTTKIVIDAMKNSLELMYFKERYSGFYAVATNKKDIVRRDYITETAKQYYEDINIASKHSSEILNLDDSEYKTSDYKKGDFSAPDIENCIQKSDYHIYIPSESEVNEKSEFSYLSLDEQLMKMIALIHQPGLITPTAIERCMQLAFSAKTNSGCISRQVGAVITDKDYSIKAVGWNEVPEGQIPCNLRSLPKLLDDSTPAYFSEYEKSGGEYNKKTFINKVSEEMMGKSLDGLKGRHCPFCFKSFHNTFEGKENQVHTRSLHAEENAMMQVVKYGGQPIKGGNLFTTASPCELCSKKAFQLGIKNIFYIDPYPGIAQTQILKASKQGMNPNLYMYQGAVGRAFHKLYEPFMSIKDEMTLLTGIKPEIKEPSVEEKIKSLIKDEEVITKIISKLSILESEYEKQIEFERIMNDILK